MWLFVATAVVQKVQFAKRKNYGTTKTKEVTVLQNTYKELNTNEQFFFDFFLKKRVKLLTALLFVTVGAVSNYYAVKQYTENNRLDMLGSSLLDYYNLGYSLLLHFSLVLFFLMRVRLLVFTATLTNVAVSLYVNTLLHLQTAGGSTLLKFAYSLREPSFFLSFTVSLCLALFPVTVVYVLMSQLLPKEKEEKVGVN